MNNLPISLRKVLETLLDQRQSRQYLRVSTSEILPARYFYNIALRDLSIKDSESAIHHLILALDIEPDHAPSLHLTKTMLFGLSKIFYEEGGELFKQKYPNVGQWVLELEKRISFCERQTMKIRNDVTKLKNSGGLLFLLFPFLKNKHLKKLDDLLQQTVKQRDEWRKQLKYSIKMAQIEEYSRILSLMLEISLYPARYSWINDKDKINTLRKEQIWYG